MAKNGNEAKPQVGDWVVTLNFGGMEARQVEEVKTKIAWVKSAYGGPRRDRVNLSDVAAFSPDKTAVDRLIDRYKSAQAERNKRVRAAEDAFYATRGKLLADFTRLTAPHCEKEKD